jgi:hypothetical protein
MMYGRGKSDSAIVAAKLVNKAGRLAAESVERRAGAKGKAAQRSTRRAQDRESVSQALDRIRKVAKERKKEKHCALPPSQCRSARAGVFRTQGQRRARCGWADMDGLRGRPRGES